MDLEKNIEQMEVFLLTNTFPICRTIEHRQIGGNSFEDDRVDA